MWLKCFIASLGTIARSRKPCSLSDKIIGKSVELDFTRPSNPNSPNTKSLSSPMNSLFRAFKSAIERSKCVPFFFKSLGLRLTVIFKGGKINSLVKSADFTLSFASCMSELARPTTENPGRPLVKVASTSIIFADNPSSVAQVKWLTMALFLFGDFCTEVFLFGGRLPL